MKDELMVLSPEKTLLSFDAATLRQRFLAQFLDLFIIVLILTVVGMVSAAFSFAFGEGATAFQAFFSTMIMFVYFVVSEGLWQGQTFGKKAAGIRVVSVDGTPITWGQAFMRNILRLADFMPAFYFMGILTSSLNYRSQRMGDLAAGTMVVVTSKYKKHFAPAVHTFGVHHFEQYVPNLDEMSLEEFLAMKRLCDRWPQLPVVEQKKSMNEIWEPFAKKHGVPAFSNVHPIYIMEAVVMKFSRMHHLL